MNMNKLEDENECTEEVSEEDASERYSDDVASAEGIEEKKKFSETMRDALNFNDKGPNSSAGQAKSLIEHFSKPLS